MDKTVAAPEADAQEAARYAAMAAELDDDVDVIEEPAEDSAEPSETKAEPAKKPETDAKDKTEEEAKKAPVSYEELEIRHRNIQGALTEERAMRKTQAEQLRQMQEVIRALQAKGQAPAQEVQQKGPTREEDPVGYFESENTKLRQQIEELQGVTKKSQEQFETQQTEQRIRDVVMQDEASFVKATPDYYDAADHLANMRMAELEMMFPDDNEDMQAQVMQMGYQNLAAYRAHLITQDKRNIVLQALRSKRSPSEMFYKLAQSRGYRPATKAEAEPVPAKKAASVIEMAKAGAKASKSLSGGGSGTDNVSTVEDLAALYLEDPELASKEFNRMKSKGLIGH